MKSQTKEAEVRYDYHVVRTGPRLLFLPLTSVSGPQDSSIAHQLFPAQEAELQHGIPSQHADYRQVRRSSPLQVADAEAENASRTGPSFASSR